MPPLLPFPRRSSPAVCLYISLCSRISLPPINLLLFQPPLLPISQSFSFPLLQPLPSCSRIPRFPPPPSLFQNPSTSPSLDNPIEPRIPQFLPLSFPPPSSSSILIFQPAFLPPHLLMFQRLFPFIPMHLTRFFDYIFSFLSLFVTACLPSIAVQACLPFISVQACLLFIQVPSFQPARPSSLFQPAFSFMFCMPPLLPFPRRSIFLSFIYILFCS